MRTLSFALVLVGFWLCLSGFFKPLLFGLGAVSVTVVVWLSLRLGLIDREGHPVQLVSRIPGYWTWLTREAVLSSLGVLRRVFVGGHRPTVGRVHIGALSELGQATLANSITLTPGTLSMRVIGDEIEVHCLDASGLEELRSGRMPRRVQRFDRSGSDDA